MLAAGSYYPYSCRPEDVRAAQIANQDNYFFVDVQSRGYYPAYVLKKLERAGIDVGMTEEDKQVLAENTVDFISFSYYSTRCSAGEGSTPPRPRATPSRVPRIPTSKRASGAGPSTRWASASR